MFLSDYKLMQQYELHSKLSEISGLCLNDKSELFAHDDELAVIFQLDINTGKVIKWFSLGTDKIPAGDFEGIAFGKGLFYMITSDGLLYVFPEGNDKVNVDYDIIDLHMPDKIDIEGLCFNEISGELMIACKNYPGKKYDNQRVIFSYKPDQDECKAVPVYFISLVQLKNEFNITDFYPSAIAKIPGENLYMILSSKRKPCMIKYSAEGRIVKAVKLDKNFHRQPEGIAITPDGSIIIADEAAGKKPLLSIYKLQESE